MTVHVTIELTEEQKLRLEAEARRQQISLSALLVEAAEMRMQRHDDAWVLAVEEGRADARAGRVMSHEKVIQRSTLRREQLRYDPKAS